jgi:hypothetical protein
MARDPTSPPRAAGLVKTSAVLNKTPSVSALIDPDKNFMLSKTKGFTVSKYALK